MTTETTTDIAEHIANGGKIAITNGYNSAYFLTAKDFAKWTAAGRTLLRHDADGRGYRLARGKGSVYLFAHQVVFVPAA